MAVFYSHDIDQHTRLAIWHIAEDEAFFLEKVPVSRSITHPHKRLQHLAGRYLLQYLFPDLPIQLIQIADTRKPYLASESHHFSISHCGDFAAAIVSTKNRVGIDIELHSDRINKIRQKFLNEHELTLEAEAGELFATIIWSAKEAMFKWYGLGEIDFQQHLQIKKMAWDSAGAILDANFSKSDPLPLSISVRTFGDLVCTWICS